MITIWKDKLSFLQTQVLELPKYAKLLHAREQLDYPMIWYSCDPTQPKEKRTFYLIGTGHEVPYDGVYLGTAILEAGRPRLTHL